MVTLLLLLSTQLFASIEDQAHSLFLHLNGVPILSSDGRFQQLVSTIKDNRWLDAAKIATEDDRFINVTVRDFAAVMSNRKESPFVPFNDFEALVMGIVRDETDARELLTANYRYEGDVSLKIPAPTTSDASHYSVLEQKGLNLKKSLVKRAPQWDGLTASAGLLTTYTWASEHLIAGTNRRATEFSFQEFLCKPLLKWKDFGLSDARIRRDIPRDPSGNPAIFQNECRTCHAALDGLTGAFANWDFWDGKILFGANWIAPKMNQNAHVFPVGYQVIDGSWVNLATEHHNELLGWRSYTEGFGLQAFGNMLAQSRAFSRCMVTRAYTKVCRKDLNDDKLLEAFATDFEQGYRLKHLFESVAVQCVKEGI